MRARAVGPGFILEPSGIGLDIPPCGGSIARLATSLCGEGGKAAGAVLDRKAEAGAPNDPGFFGKQDRPPTTRELGRLLRRHVKTVYQHILALVAQSPNVPPTESDVKGDDVRIVGKVISVIRRMS